MAVTQGPTLQFKLDMLNGVHQPGDTYKIALYNASSANLNKNTTTYSTTGEVAGVGYTAGGKELAGRTVALSGDIAYLDFDDPVWPSATITADSASIYNASRSNKVLGSFTFTVGSSTNGNFTVQMPTPGSSAAIRIP